MLLWLVLVALAALGYLAFAPGVRVSFVGWLDASLRVHGTGQHCPVIRISNDTNKYIHLLEFPKTSDGYEFIILDVSVPPPPFDREPPLSIAPNSHVDAYVVQDKYSSEPIAFAMVLTPLTKDAYRAKLRKADHLPAILRRWFSHRDTYYVEIPANSSRGE
jgi:hypothetical protein